MKMNRTDQAFNRCVRGIKDEKTWASHLLGFYFCQRSDDNLLFQQNVQPPLQYREYP